MAGSVSHGELHCRHNFLGESPDDLGRIGIAQIEDQVRRAGIHEALNVGGGLSKIVVVDRQLYRKLDLGRVAADGGAVLAKDFDFVEEGLDRATGEVPDVGVARNNAQRQLLPATADDKWWVGFCTGLGSQRASLSW